jgi:cytochrome c5
MWRRFVPFIGMLLLAAAAIAGQQLSQTKSSPVPHAEKLLGEQIYTQACAACHASGIAGAPKLGDRAAWAPHIRVGIEHLVEIAIQGKGNMPPRGGQADLSDAEIRAAVDYMVAKSR